MIQVSADVVYDVAGPKLLNSLEPKMVANIQTPLFYRTKRFWIPVVLIGVVCVPVTYWMYADWKLQSELDAIRAAGFPTNGAELNDFYVIPEGEIDSTALWLTAIRALDNSDFQTNGQNLPFVGEGSPPKPGEEWEQLEEAREFLADFEDNLRLIHEAAEAGGVVRFPVDFQQGIGVLLPDSEESRTTSRLLQLDAHVAALDDDTDRVMQDILSMFALSDALRAEPCLVSQFIRFFHYRIGCRTIELLLPQTNWNDEQLVTLQMAIGNAQFREALHIGLHGEQAIMLTAIEEMPSLLATSEKRAALPLFRIAIDAAKLPWPDAIRDQHKIATLLEPADHRFLPRFRICLVELLFPATGNLTVAAANGKAQQHCTITALAAERHRLKHGRLPTSLSVIPDQFFPEGIQTPDDLITDPFTGEQLHYLIDDTHATIYSVGENGTDDGGQIESEFGLPPDVGFALQRHGSNRFPPLLHLSNGQSVSTPAMWQKRRREIKELMQSVVYGHLPERPDQVTCTDITSGPIPNCDGTEERMTLVIGSDTQLRMKIAVYRPPVDGPLPVIIREEHALGHIEEVPNILARGYMFAEFQREDLDPDSPDAVGPAQAAYPDSDWATLAVWAWGAMRVVDYLETRDDVDLTKLTITGHSRGGKMALLAGALDERFALVAANGSGCGGAGCFRIQEGKVETLELITRPERFGYWFHKDLRQWVGREHQLPVDQHFLKALVAPRALICTDALGDEWANPVGNRATSEAAETVFRFLGATRRNALHFREGSHDFTEADWTAIMDFADWHLLGRIPDNPDRFFQFATPDKRRSNSN